jgi:hypothetical protein
LFGRIEEFSKNIFGEPDVVKKDIEAQVGGADNMHPEPEIDAKRAEKDAELVKYIQVGELIIPNLQSYMANYVSRVSINTFRMWSDGRFCRPGWLLRTGARRAERWTMQPRPQPPLRPGPASPDPEPVQSLGARRGPRPPLLRLIRHEGRKEGWVEGARTTGSRRLAGAPGSRYRHYRNPISVLND